MRWIALFIASAGFSGFLPGLLNRKKLGAGAGLVGSLIGAAMLYGFYKTDMSGEMVFVAAVVSFFAGLATIGSAEELILKQWGPQKRHTGEMAIHDFNQTNIDEVHGQLVAGLPLFLLPQLDQTEFLFLLSVSLLLFRFFDVIKPWPIKEIEEIFDGPAGVMLDDTVAGVAAAFIVWLLGNLF